MHPKSQGPKQIGDPRGRQVGQRAKKLQGQIIQIDIFLMAFLKNSEKTQKIPKQYDKNST
jgi:hypothetical protein